MAARRKNEDIFKGSKLMVFMGGSPIGFATSHSLSMTMNTSEVSTKDHGDSPTVIPQNISWEVTAENLFSEAGEITYMNAMQSMAPVELVFAEASNYSNVGEDATLDLPLQDPGAEWALGKIIGKGKALVTSFSINAPAGDNATMSVTFTGQGPLKVKKIQNDSDTGTYVISTT